MCKLLWLRTRCLKNTIGRLHTLPFISYLLFDSADAHRVCTCMRENSAAEGRAMNSTDCPFCKIARHALPAEILYEDTNVIALLSINPIHYRHALVIPKAHAPDFFQQREDCPTVGPSFPHARYAALSRRRNQVCSSTQTIRRHRDGGVYRKKIRQYIEREEAGHALG
ncbi:MAG: hypothetical protein C4326_02405 [Ignavibacteria bacterium]